MNAVFIAHLAISDSDLFSHSNDVNFLNLNSSVCENDNEVINSVL